MKFARWSIPTQLVAACFIYVTKRTRTSTASLTEQPERILTHHKNRRELVKIKVHCNFPCSKSIGGGGQTFALKRRFCAPSVSYGRVDPFLWLFTSERKKAAFSDIVSVCLFSCIFFLNQQYPCGGVWFLCSQDTSRQSRWTLQIDAVRQNCRWRRKACPAVRRTEWRRDGRDITLMPLNRRSVTELRSVKPQICHLFLKAQWCCDD